MFPLPKPAHKKFYFRQDRAAWCRSADDPRGTTLTQAFYIPGDQGVVLDYKGGLYTPYSAKSGDRISERYGGVCMALAHTSPGQHYPNVFDDRNKAYAVPAGVEYKLLRQETGENCYILTEYPLDRSQPDWTTFGEPQNRQVNKSKKSFRPQTLSAGENRLDFYCFSGICEWPAFTRRSCRMSHRRFERST